MRQTQAKEQATWRFLKMFLGFNFQNTKFRNQENNRSKGTSNSRGNEPRGNNLSNTFPTPNNVLSTFGSNGGTNNSTNNRMGSRDWHTNGGGNSQPS